MYAITIITLLINTIFYTINKSQQKLVMPTLTNQTTKIKKSFGDSSNLTTSTTSTSNETNQLDSGIVIFMKKINQKDNHVNSFFHITSGIYLPDNKKEIKIAG